MESPLRITLQMTLICNASLLHTENITGDMPRRQQHYGPRGVDRAPDKTKADRLGTEAGGDITFNRGFNNRIDHPFLLHLHCPVQPVAPPLPWPPENGSPDMEHHPPPPRRIANVISYTLSASAA